MSARIHREFASYPKSTWTILTSSRFGLVATVLEMVPIASMFFTYTNTGKWRLQRPKCNDGMLTETTVGAALWAADLEAHSTSLTKETAPNLRAAADKATEKSEL